MLVLIVLPQSPQNQNLLDKCTNVPAVEHHVPRVELNPQPRIGQVESDPCMRRTLSLVTIVLVLAASVMVFQPASAEGKTLTVPSEYPTIKQAIQNATDGDAIIVKSGTYNESIVIDRAITLRGEDTNNTIINGNSTGTVILITHDSVTVTGLTIQYDSTPNSPRTYWVHNLPAGFLANPGNEDAIGYPKDSGYFTRYGQWRLAGVHILKAYYCNISGNRIFDCGMGVWLYKSSNNNIKGNELARNDYGLVIDDSNRNTFFGNTVRDGGGGFWFTAKRPYYSQPRVDSANNTFSENNFINNQKPYERQFLVNSSVNSWDNGKLGNYWSDYIGNDTDQDGIGDLPYPIVGETYTGGLHRQGAWVDQFCGQDNYPLTAPFNTASLFANHKEPTIQQETPNTPDLTLVEVAVSAAVIIAIAALIVYSKHHRNHN